MERITPNEAKILAWLSEYIGTEPSDYGRAKDLQQFGPSVVENVKLDIRSAHYDVSKWQWLYYREAWDSPWAVY